MSILDSAAHPSHKMKEGFDGEQYCVKCSAVLQPKGVPKLATNFASLISPCYLGDDLRVNPDWLDNQITKYKALVSHYEALKRQRLKEITESR